MNFTKTAYEAFLSTLRIKAATDGFSEEICQLATRCADGDKAALKSVRKGLREGYMTHQLVIEQLLEGSGEYSFAAAQKILFPLLLEKGTSQIAAHLCILSIMRSGAWVEDMVAFRIVAMFLQRYPNHPTQKIFDILITIDASEKDETEKH